jgi:hypothetical protein
MAGKEINESAGKKPDAGPSPFKNMDRACMLISEKLDPATSRFFY